LEATYDAVYNAYLRCLKLGISRGRRIRAVIVPAWYLPSPLDGGEASARNFWNRMQDMCEAHLVHLIVDERLLPLPLSSTSAPPPSSLSFLRIGSGHTHVIWELGEDLGLSGRGAILSGGGSESGSLGGDVNLPRSSVVAISALLESVPMEGTGCDALVKYLSPSAVSPGGKDAKVKKEDLSKGVKLNALMAQRRAHLVEIGETMSRVLDARKVRSIRAPPSPHPPSGASAPLTLLVDAGPHLRPNYTFHSESLLVRRMRADAGIPYDAVRAGGDLRINEPGWIEVDLTRLIELGKEGAEAVAAGIARAILGTEPGK
jgi:hypothetical protein